jgi:TonB family protein
MWIVRGRWRPLMIGRLIRHAVTFAAALITLCPYVRAQNATTSPPAASKQPAYANSTDGLHQLLGDMLQNAKNGDTSKLEAAIQETEIPDYKKWFTSTFGEEKGESWADPYERNLQGQEDNFEDLINHIAAHEGKITVEKIDATKRYDTLKGPLDLYFAHWVPARREKSESAKDIGYFVFIDGKFRWDSTVVFIKTSSLFASPLDNSSGTPNNAATPPAQSANRARPRRGSFPTCEYCPPAAFPKNGAGFEGTVVLKVTVEAEGYATHIEVVKNPLPASFADAAIASVRQWRFKPAVDEDGEPVAVTTVIQVTYHHY